MSTLALNVNNQKVQDQCFISEPAATYSAKRGYVQATITSLANISIDKPADVTTPAAHDSVPMFTIKNAKSGAAKDIVLIQHPLAKRSGTRTYTKKLMIFAINSGKVDGNGTNVKATTSQVNFLDVQVQKIKEWPCDDKVDLTLTYTTSFTDLS